MLVLDVGAIPPGVVIDGTTTVPSTVTVTVLVGVLVNVTNTGTVFVTVGSTTR